MAPQSENPCFSYGTFKRPELQFNLDHMVYQPSLEELSDFNKYLEFVLQDSVNKYGIGKIQLPTGFKPGHHKLRNVNKCRLSRVWEQSVVPCEGAYLLTGPDVANMTVSKYQSHCSVSPYNSAYGLSVAEKEEKCWDMLSNPDYRVLYGLEYEGSLFKPNERVINPQRLGTLLDLIHKMGLEIPGVSSPMVYFGLPYITFSWHVEDKNLLSYNLLHHVDPADSINGGKLW